MIVLTVQDVRKHYGPEPVLDGVTFDVRLGQRIALVGPNGAGKTTLLRILAGREDADAGAAQLHSTVRCGYLEQQPEFEADRTLWAEAKSALDHLAQLQHEAEFVAAAMAEADSEDEHRRLTERFDHLQHELHRHDAYNLDYQIERVLDGLRFPRESFNQPVASLSGGEQNRLMLAKLLLAQPDIMLLDEPSNHLDIAATEWLEQFLTGSDAAMVLVSHDRYFLDRVANRTLELFRGTVESYPGNFSAYWRQKEERLLVQRRTYEKQQIEIAKAEEFIRRNHYGQKAAQAEDRRKKLERIERVPPPREIGKPAMRFAAAVRPGDIVLRAEGVGKTFDRPLFSDVSFDVIRGQRWSLLGPNGSGKTTLLRCLLGELDPDAGRIVLGQGVEVGYFDQQLAGLADDAQVVDAVRPPKKDFVEQQRRDLLARFGITGDTALQNVGQLSGGERCRTALARLAAMDANFLILDEPTNHLDLWARDALENAIREFEGTVLFVSHDRYFVDRVADHLLIIEPDQVRVFEGNYREYQQWITSPDRAADGAGEPVAQRAVARKPDRAPVRRRKFPYRKAVDLESEIDRRETRIEEIHHLLAQAETHRDGALVRQLKNEVVEHQEALPGLMEHWEEAVEMNW